jgi:CrcB protein
MPLSWAIAIPLVALGGALGAALRFLVVGTITGWLGAAAPIGTLVVNLMGSFVMGIAAVGIARACTPLLAPLLAPLLMTGVLGGFTTFSAFAHEMAGLLEQGASIRPVLYALASMVGTVLAVFAGLWVGRSLWS